MIRSARQLRDKIKNMAAAETGARKTEKAQALLRIFMMERFLERFAVSEYRDRFILKGGMLVAAHTGLDSRATKDIDTSIRMLSIQMEDIRKTLIEISQIDINDGVAFEFQSAEPIMEEHDYPGIRFGINALFEGTKQHFAIDISTDDIITPDAVTFAYPLMFEERTIPLLAYNLETLLAEKMETILSRGTANTRIRDFYDIYMLTVLKPQKISRDDFIAAFHATAEKRGTEKRVPVFSRILNSIQESDEMLKMWDRFRKTYYYVEDTAWTDVLTSVQILANWIIPDEQEESRTEKLEPNKV